LAATTRRRIATRARIADTGSVVAIAQKHCVACHAIRPTHEAFPEAPKGVRLETVEELRRYAVLIEQQAVRSDVMPLGNETGMTDDERRDLGAWLGGE